MLTIYVTDRYHAVNISDQVSHFIKMKADYRQGSTLGPLLFVIYTSSLFDVLEYCQFQFCVEDSQIYCSFNLEGKNIAERPYIAPKQHSLFLNAKNGLYCCSEFTRNFLGARISRYANLTLEVVRKLGVGSYALILHLMQNSYFKVFAECLWHNRHALN